MDPGNSHNLLLEHPGDVTPFPQEMTVTTPQPETSSGDFRMHSLIAGWESTPQEPRTQGSIYVRLAFPAKDSEGCLREGAVPGLLAISQAGLGEAGIN